MQNNTDDQLMTAAKMGNNEAMSEIFQRYQKPMFNFFLKLTGNYTESDDFLQEVFYKIIQSRDSYRAGSNFRAWIYTIAKNLYRDHLRTHRMHVHLDEVEDTLTDNSSTDETLLWSEEQKLIHKALKRLPENKQQVLVLSRFQQLKYEEISEIMNISISSVKVTVFRALKELKANYLELAGELV